MSPNILISKIVPSQNITGSSLLACLLAPTRNLYIVCNKVNLLQLCYFVNDPNELALAPKFKHHSQTELLLRIMSYSGVHHPSVLNWIEDLCFGFLPFDAAMFQLVSGMYCRNGNSPTAPSEKDREGKRHPASQTRDLWKLLGHFEIEIKRKSNGALYYNESETCSKQKCN